MASVDDWKKELDKRKQEYSSLHNRMDDDMDLYLLKEYKLTDFDGKAVKGADNVTLASPKILADRCISVIATAGPIVTVSGDKMEGKDNLQVEKFINMVFYNANKRLRRRNILPIHTFCTSTSILQGWVGIRNVIYTAAEGTLIIDVEPLDMRNCYWQMGADGLLWAAYETPKQPPSVIMERYGIEVEGETDVIDFWTKDEHIIWVGKDVAEAKPHAIGEVPFVINPVALTPQLGKAEFENLGESIFATNRALYPEANKQITILQSLNSLYFRPPIGVLTQDGKALPDEYPYTPAMLMAMRVGEGFTPLPLGDVTKSAPFAYSIVNKEIQLGGLPYSEFGTLDFPLSAIAIEKLEGHRDQVFLPRIQTLSTSYVDSMLQIIKQYTEGQFQESFKDAVGDEQEYNSGDLKGKYTIGFRLSTTSPEKSITNFQVARAAMDLGLPRDVINRDILELDDPEGTMDKQMWEMAGQIPAVALYRMGESMLRLSETKTGEESQQAKDEANIILNEFNKLMQMQQGPQGGPEQGMGGMGGVAPPREPPNLMAEEGLAESDAAQRIGRPSPVQGSGEEV